MNNGSERGIARYRLAVQRRSAALSRALSREMRRIAIAWLTLILLASALKLTFAPIPIHNWSDLLEVAFPYLIIALAPVAGYRLAAGSFPSGSIIAQPGIRLSRYGKWRPVNPVEARSDPAFGPAGFMASLLIGLLLNVVLRTIEFLLAMPALNGHAPAWSAALFRLMAADVAVMSFFYMVCFVMALRTVPLFPRMLLFAWALDILIQMLIARQIGAMPGLPSTVAVPLRGLLEGNVYKVLISAFVWLPYLILSDRVNLTYRQRARIIIRRD